MFLYFLIPASVFEIVFGWVDRSGNEERNSFNHLISTTNTDFKKWSYFKENERFLYRDRAKEMFYHGFNSYMNNAYPYDELDPIGCKGRGPDLEKPSNININDILGNYSLTLIDSLDTLAVVGDKQGFQNGIRLVTQNVDFNQPHSVNLFEVNIRVLGSLLSAHQIITENLYGFNMEMYNNELLSLAENLGRRLLPAFDTATGIPNPRVRLDGGRVHTSDSTDTTVASATSLILEFGTLSQLTGNDTYIRLAREATESVWKIRNNITGLFPIGVDASNNEITNPMAGIGAGMDSFMEYLFKSYIMFGRELDFSRFHQMMSSMKKYARQGRTKCFSGEGHVPFYVNVNHENGNVVNNWIDSLGAFFPGLLTLSGDIEEAVCLHFLYFTIWRMFDALPERYNWNMLKPEVMFYPLRPELIESTYHLYRATKSPFYLHVGAELLDSLNRNVRTDCGFATMHSVTDRSLEDRMESFFLAETVKYLYLLFDEENELHSTEKWIFNTEGHLLKINQPDSTSSSFCSSSVPNSPLNSTNTNLACPGQCFRFSRRYDALPMPEEFMKQTEIAIGLRIS